MTEAEELELLELEEAEAAAQPRKRHGASGTWELPDPGFLDAMGTRFNEGLTKKGSDELVGQIARHKLEPTPGRYLKLPDGREMSAQTPEEAELAFREGERQRQQAAKQHYPKSGFVADMAGEIAGDVAAGGARMVAPAYQALVGGVRGYLGTDSDDVADKAVGAGAGATTGYALAKLLSPEAMKAVSETRLARAIAESRAGQAVGEGISTAVRWPGEALDSFANRRALKAAGYIQKDIKPIMVHEGAEALEQRGADLLDQGAVRFGRTAEDVAERTAKAKAAAGERVGEIFRRADESGVAFDVMPFVKRAHSEIIEPLSHDPALLPELTRVRKLLDEYVAAAQKPGGLTFSEANAMKRSLQNSINWNSSSPNAQALTKKLQGIMTDEIDSQVAAWGPEGTAQALKEAKRLYGSMKASTQAAREGVARNEGNRFFGMGVTEGLGTAGPLYFASQGQFGRAAGAAAAALGAKLLKERGPSSAAVLSRGLGKTYLAAIERTPEIFGEFGAVVLGQKTPEAREAAAEALAAKYPQFAALFLDATPRPVDSSASR